MRKLAILLLFGSAFAAHGQYVNVISTHLGDTLGVDMSSGSLCLQPTDLNGNPTPYRAGGLSGIKIGRTVCVPVTNGSMSAQIVDTSATTPGICLKVTAQPTGAALYPIASCLQTSAANGVQTWCNNGICNLDQASIGNTQSVGTYAPITTYGGSEQIAAGTPTAMTVPWGFSPNNLLGGKYINIFDNVSAFPLNPSGQIQRNYNFTADLMPDFTGAPGASIPTFEVEISTSGGSNLQAHAIDGYVVNNGSQDAVAIGGRVQRLAGATSTTSGLAEASGGYFSAFNLDSLPGFTAGAESVILNQVSGTTAKDRWSLTETNGGTGALHLSSISSGSPADALILMDSNNSSGYYGVWNGLLMDGNNFKGYKTAGTVGWNAGSWNNANGAPETGWKEGDTLQDIWKIGTQPFVINSSIGQVQIYGNGNNATTPTTNAGTVYYAGTGTNAYTDFFVGGVRQANIAFLGGSGYGYFDVNGVGTTDTHINRLGGLLYAPTPTSSAAVAGQHQVVTVDYLSSKTLPYFTPSGTIVNNAHSVGGGATMSASGTFTATFSGSAVFTSATTYVCNANSTTSTTTAIEVSFISGSQVTFTGTASSGFVYNCFGS